MEILFLADNFAPERNAQASRVFERACYWARWGHSVTVITCAPNFPDGKVFDGYKNRWCQIEQMSGIRVVRVKTFIAANKGRVLRIIDFLSFMIAAFTAGLFQRRPDIVVSTSPQFFTAIAGFTLAAVRQVPFIFELSDLWPESVVAVGAMKASFALRALESIELFLYRQSARVVALTPAFKQNLTGRGISPDKVAVVINGVDLDRYSPRPRKPGLAARWGIASEEFVVSYIGTLGMAHGLRNVLDAAENLRGAKVRFLLVGPGAERDMLVAEAERRGLSNVTFVPAQPKEAMPDYWSLSDVALVHLKDSPLFRTVIPSKIFEAMAMGLPILLVAPQGEASRIVLDERVGVWIPAAEPETLAHTVLDLQSAPERLREFGLAACGAAPRHSREKQAAEMFAVLLAGATQPAPKLAIARRTYRIARRHILRHTAAVRAMERLLHATDSPDECWHAVVATARTLKLPFVLLSLGGRSYEYRGSDGHRPTAGIRIPLTSTDFVEIACDSDMSAEHHFQTTFANSVVRGVQPKIVASLRAHAVGAD